MLAQKKTSKRMGSSPSRGYCVVLMHQTVLVSLPAQEYFDG